jgi:YegS/Rv2252/BmrU family lipid kinase
VIVNPMAKGGLALAVFRSVEERFTELFEDVEVAVTPSLDAVADRVAAGIAAGAGRLIAVGGDGTNNAVISAMANAASNGTAFGALPVGTGGDWARSLGTPSRPLAALQWLARCSAIRCDLGRVDIAHDGAEPSSRFFLNISSAGVGGEVVARVNRQVKKGAGAFLSATLRTLLTYKPKPIRVVCDGTTFFEGGFYLLAVANGRAFGRGMKIAPTALIDDGRFDVIIVREAWRPVFFMSLPRVFLGTHLSHRVIRYTRASEVRLESMAGAIDLDLDGENGRGSSVTYTVLPRAISVLGDPATAPLVE